MNTCPYQQKCGGCSLRHLSIKEYQAYKAYKFTALVKQLQRSKDSTTDFIFIDDGMRRRCELDFKLIKGKLFLGFNATQSHELVDIHTCPSLTLLINQNLPHIRNFLAELCQIKISTKKKNKLITENIIGGSIHITNADNGLDVLIKTNTPFNLEHRILTCDFVNSQPDIVRISMQMQNKIPEIIVEKVAPIINMNNAAVNIPPGAFLQASFDGQKALADTVKEYIGNVNGNIADLFCGIGTFSYYLSDNIKNKITAVDSAFELISEFQKNINRLVLPNIKIVQRNLFKYPLDTQELSNFDIIIFDPPRAGAKAQITKICELNSADKPQKIIAISCNPHTFVNDAVMLAENGYNLNAITMIDQFVYNKHFELVALFERI